MLIINIFIIGSILAVYIGSIIRRWLIKRAVIDIAISMFEGVAEGRIHSICGVTIDDRRYCKAVEPTILKLIKEKQ